jgi:PAS domain S-box-containing protein
MSDDYFKYDLLFELSPDLLCIAGFDGYFKKINPAVANALGYSLEELYARPINDFVHPDDKAATSNARTELTKSKPLLNFENRYVTKTGEIVWLSWTSLPIPSDDLIFAIAKNITHKKRQEAERNAMLANLTKINKDLKQLTFTTSHDLRSPVNGFLSLLSLIEVSKITDPQTIEIIEVIKLAGANLKKTLNEYVDNISAKHRIEEETVNLHQTVNSVLHSIGSLIQTSRAEIHTDFSKLENIRCNTGYLESIILNLITNSIKYSRPGNIPIISISSDRGSGFNRLKIADNGIGFDMEKVKGKIFGLHQKFHDHGDSKGIGLYLVHAHVTSLGGHIDVESNVNEGTTFVISFRE